jgi:hypothetical protein
MKPKKTEITDKLRREINKGTPPRLNILSFFRSEMQCDPTFFAFLIAVLRNWILLVTLTRIWMRILLVTVMRIWILLFP